MNEDKRNVRDVWKDNYLKAYTSGIALTYFIAFAVMIAMAVANVAFSNNKELDVGLGKFLLIDEYLEVNGGEKFNTSKIDTYEVNEYGSISVFYKLPSKMSKDQSIVFRSKNSYVEAIIEGECIYRTDISEGPFSNKSPGVRWNLLSVADEHAGKTIELRVRLAYYDGRSKIDTFYLGDRATIIIEIVKEMRWELVSCILILLIGTIYLITNIIMNRNQKLKDNSLFYLSIFSVVSSLWALLETDVVQLFVENQPAVQIVSDMMLILGGVPLFLYMESVYGIFKFRIVRIGSFCTTAYTVFATISQFIGFWDYNQTLNGAILNYMFVIITMVGCLLREGIMKHRFYGSGKFYIEYVTQQTGLIALAVCLFIDVYRYVVIDAPDRASFTRLGISIFIILLGAGTIYRLFKLVEQGRQTELISKLAYQDGLTQVGNRTAYKERLEQLAKSNEHNGCCFVMLDINNLKQVNDTRGHQSGDQLIKAATEIINNSFGLAGEVYRIGGDEFVVLIVNNNPLESYEELLPVFEKLLYSENKRREWKEEISIAHGKAYCEHLSRYGLKSTEQEADTKMYKNKVKMKSDRKMDLR
ncbi:MAG: GGDEF domain-containing protein [bacterium]|nr:GGDEF domain-containing protein [bacterium]